MLSFGNDLEQNPQFIATQLVYHTLRQHGYQVLLAGGAVRDALLGRPPQDFDLATSATPDQVQSLFTRTIDVGKQFGSVVVVQDGVEIEVTTFRADIGATDGRRPDSVQFSSAEEDAKRRDFTINGLFYDLEKKQVLDYVGGKVDLKAELIRAIGEPALRFSEDHLRILRGVRFVAQLGFSLEPSTLAAMKQHAQLVHTVSAERRLAEMRKLLMGAQSTKALQLLLDLKIWQTWFELPASAVVDPNLPQQFEVVLNAEIFAWLCFWQKSLVASQKTFADWQKLWQAWRFSKAEQRSFNSALEFFFYTPAQWQQQPLGALIEKILEPASYVGLRLYQAANPKIEHIGEALATAQALGMTKPVPLVTAKDLMAHFSGEKLGTALREVYWKQLESVVKTKDQALSWCLLNNPAKG